MKKLSLWKRVAAPGLLFLAFGRMGTAQTLPAPPIGSLPLPDDTVQVNLLALPPDSLVAAPVDSVKLLWAQTPPELRDLVGDRVGCIETDMPHVFNNSVLAYVNFFTQRNRAYTQRVLERENMYFPIFEKYLAKYDLPNDLKYLAVVESALIPTAKSRVGATGLWQFMGPTASDWRLVRDEWVDERMSPEKATEAACKYLRALYGVFHDWELVLASYNWGVGNVQRVIRRTGKKNFWDLYPYMPKETRNYVPTFTAIMYTMKYAREHQLHSSELRYQYAEPLDTLHLRGKAFDLRRLSQAVGLSDSLALLRYNPEIKRAYLPSGYRSYVIQVPSALRAQLVNVDRSTLFAYCQPLRELPQPLVPLPPHMAGAPATPAMLAAAAPPPEAPRLQRKVHTVRRGQTIATVARNYGVSQSQLRRWNKLSSRQQTLRTQQKLVLFVPTPAEKQPTPTPTYAKVAAQVPEALPTVASARRADGTVVTPVAVMKPVAPAAAIATATVTPTRSAARRTEAPTPTHQEHPTAVPETSPVAVASIAPADTAATLYTVRRGDNLSKIAQRHDVTVAQLMDWNPSASSHLMPGQKLTLYVAQADEETPAAPVLTAAAHKPVPRSKPAAPTLLPPRTYLVQPGDTLYNISRRYQGVTVEQLRRLNHLKSDAVKPGQKLIVETS
ncbi:LysM peptidoglycan-binding domain-containing protein [Hymenobacter sp. NBH84]|uniref:LysM peptidoglycan-binding domain-containing protein n=1 Tax=Hymenobacter sp. NBH84 TaxID=2596915 RepID=UPI0016236B57|nr:lytic transglycosylase domain-containing protein [Hymenobacter sp. NBH84]QNE40820.1 LysM peptidoglycan-binding domain-containing protein [Hymenobacter sp. NBH84]